ncbi:MAG: hypothetical protein ACR2OZ_05670 [Verrucomicrobiales bacterium]
MSNPNSQSSGGSEPPPESTAHHRRGILDAEVVGKFDHPGDANKLVYSPLTTKHTFRSTRRYALEFEGHEDAVRDFVRRTLVEEVSQDVHFGESPALEGFSFILDYGFRPGALDLEKETILSYYRGLKSPTFTFHKLFITQRIYIFAEQETEAPEKFVRDIVNPAIHRHEIIRADHRLAQGRAR